MYPGAVAWKKGPTGITGFEAWTPLRNAEQATAILDSSSRFALYPDIIRLAYRLHRLKEGICN